MAEPRRLWTIIASATVVLAGFSLTLSGCTNHTSVADEVVLATSTWHPPTAPIGLGAAVSSADNLPDRSIVPVSGYVQEAFERNPLREGCRRGRAGEAGTYRPGHQPARSAGANHRTPRAGANRRRRHVSDAGNQPEDPPAGTTGSRREGRRSRGPYRPCAIGGSPGSRLSPMWSMRSTVYTLSIGRSS